MVQQTRYIPSFKDIPRERQPMLESPVEERVTNFKEVELGFTQEQAMLEATRCLSCRKCLGCGLCAAVCHASAIDLTAQDKEFEVEVDSIVLAPEVASFGLREEIFDCGKYLNVLDFIHFRQMLNDNGPYGGLLLRPSDGQIPTKIAFIADFERQNVNPIMNYASKEAMDATKKVKGLEIQVFLPGPKVNGVGENSPGVFYRTGQVTGVEEKADHNLVVQFREDGQVREEEFDMVVLFGWLRLPPHIRDLDDKLGLNLNNAAFLETGDISLKETGKANVFLAGYQFQSPQTNKSSK